MASGIADAQKNRFVFVVGYTEGFFASEVPVHPVLSVLEKMRTGFIGQAIWHECCVSRVPVSSSMIVTCILTLSETAICNEITLTFAPWRFGENDGKLLV